MTTNEISDEKDLKRYIELMAIIQEEVGEAQKELNNVWFNKSEGDIEKFRIEVKQIVSPLMELIEMLGLVQRLK